MTAALVALLDRCSKNKDPQTGALVHADVLRQGLLGKSVYVTSKLVSMYAKCGALAKAIDVLEGLHVRNVISWNALIAAYAQREHGMKALNCYEQMLHEGLCPDGATFACILKVCGSIQALDKGTSVHYEIVRRGLLEGDTVLGGALVDMYAKCGALPNAKKVFDELSVHTTILWNVLIARYVQQELASEALDCFEQMKCEGVTPDAVTFACILKACGNVHLLDKGKDIHDEIDRMGLLGDVILGGALVDMYVKCSSLANAKEVLELLSVQDAVLWNTLISGYLEEGNAEGGLICFDQMQSEGVSPDAVTFACLLKAYGSIGAYEKGAYTHSEIVRQGLLGGDIVLGNALVDMYMKCGALAKAKEVIEELPLRDVASWSSIIAGYVQGEHGDEALACYQHMRYEGLLPNAIAFACVLKACGSIGALEEGERIHSNIIRLRLLGENVVLGGALVIMYASCGAFKKAQGVLKVLPVQDAVSWNALITGYIQGEKVEEALNCFEWMQHEGICPDAVTYACVLKACGSIGALGMGEKILSEITSQGFLCDNIVIGNALVDMYAKCGALVKAKELLRQLPVRNVISWSALIAGYAQIDDGKEALHCFEQMQHEGLLPNAITFACILKACASIGALDKGIEFHSEIVRQGLLGGDVLLGGALVDMYAKCGALSVSKDVLEGLPVRDVVSWNTLLASYAKGDHGIEALNCLERMLYEGLIPNGVTFLCLLSACSHSGLVDQGQNYFMQMSLDYGVTPDLGHLTCMVNIFGQVGHLDEAAALTKMMASSDYLPMWVVMLTACKKWGNMKLGKWVFEHAMCLDLKAILACGSVQD